MAGNKTNVVKAANKGSEIINAPMNARLAHLALFNFRDSSSAADEKEINVTPAKMTTPKPSNPIALEYRNAKKSISGECLAIQTSTANATDTKVIAMNIWRTLNLNRVMRDKLLRSGNRQTISFVGISQNIVKRQH